MNLIVRIPDDLAERVSAADPARLEQAALQAVLRATEDAAESEGRDHRAMAGIDSDLSPQEAAARMRAARPGNQLPEGVSIRDLMTYGRA
jgi:hypothetical protein